MASFGKKSKEVMCFDEDDQTFCFTNEEFREALKTGINPYTGKRIPKDAIENYFKSPRKGGLLSLDNPSLFNISKRLSPKSRRNFDTLLKEIGVDRSSPKHASFTEEAMEYDFNQLATELGYRAKYIRIDYTYTAPAGWKQKQYVFDLESNANKYLLQIDDYHNPLHKILGTVVDIVITPVSIQDIRDDPVTKKKIELILKDFVRTTLLPEAVRLSRWGAIEFSIKMFERERDAYRDVLRLAIKYDNTKIAYSTLYWLVQKYAKKFYNEAIVIASENDSIRVFKMLYQLRGSDVYLKQWNTMSKMMPHMAITSGSIKIMEYIWEMTQTGAISDGDKIVENFRRNYSYVSQLLIGNVELNLAGRLKEARDAHDKLLIRKMTMEMARFYIKHPEAMFSEEEYDQLLELVKDFEENVE